MEQSKIKRQENAVLDTQARIKGALARFGESTPVTLQAQLLSQLEALLCQQNARGLGFMIAYYGLGDEAALTLEGIGQAVPEVLTRERVRQIIDSALQGLLDKENQDRSVRPYAQARALFEEESQRAGHKVLPLTALGALPYFAGFENNEKGLIAFLSDAGVRQVVYRAKRYVYAQGLERREAIAQIQDRNKKTRREKTMGKMANMAKTVTYVPADVREALATRAQKENLALNRLYEEILLLFMEKNPYAAAADFGKTKSWRARQGKAQWQQVGIYIEKAIFEQAKLKAAEIKPGKVSNMSYICHAFVWFCSQPERELVLKRTY